MYPNWRAEMARAGITSTELASRLDKSVSWISDRMTGRTALTLEDARKIRGAMGINMPIEKLFERAGEINEVA